jgi:CRP/FNR family transcriptional regulator, cyclic AMP receptor protein
MSVRADAETLRLIPIFQECDPVPLQIMAFAAPRKNFAADNTIIEQGETGRTAYLILSGTVRLKRAGVEIAIAEEGSLLGETGMIGGLPYSLTAQAVGDVSVAQIDNELFMRVSGEYPEFGRAVLLALAQKLDVSVREFDQVRTRLNKAGAFSDL